MGHRYKDLLAAYDAVRHHCGEISSSYNDGYMSALYKEELYQFKCYLEDMYKTLPTIVGEEKWEQNRVIQLLKK